MYTVQCTVCSILIEHVAGGAGLPLPQGPGVHFEPKGRESNLVSIIEEDFTNN